MSKEKYFIIHVKYGRREGEGYSVFIKIDDGDERTAIEQMKEKGYFDWIEDVSDIGYVREITQEEYEQWQKTTSALWESGYMLRNKVFKKRILNVQEK